jgi:SAM-dependent methyltransferase
VRDPSFLLQRAFRHFRTQRLRLFERTFAISEGTRILDVGGSPEIWSFLNLKPQLTILNMPSALSPHSHASMVGADGRMLPFSDGAFDIVFSNSVIEHVGNREDQRLFAREVSRVGRNYWIQTPNRQFPFEHHVMLPAVHFLPKRWQQAVVHRFTGWEHIVRPTADERRNYLHHFLNELNLLDTADMKALFPDANVIKERFLGIPKSLIAVKM